MHYEGFGTGSDSQRCGNTVTAKNLNDDILLEIFNACRVDIIDPNTYPRNWWYSLAHVCQRWRCVLLAAPTRLRLTLICNSRTPVADLLANSPPLPLIIYWGNPGTVDTEDSVENLHLALQHRDRVCRINLRMSESSFRNVFTSMGGNFPILETLQLHSSSFFTRYSTLPNAFGAPNLRHLQLSDWSLFPSQQSSPLLNTIISNPSLVTFSLSEITSDLPPKRLSECLSLMPNIRTLKIGHLFVNSPRERQRDNEGQPPVDSVNLDHCSTLLTDLEEFQYHGPSDYFDRLAALINAPFLKKLSITFTDTLYPSGTITIMGTQAKTIPRYLATLISEAWELRFQFARVRFQDGLSIVMDHNELWTGRGAFELRFNQGVRQDVKLAAEVCRLLGPIPSAVESLLLEDGQNGHFKVNADRKVWHDLLRPFDNVKTLRVANRFVDELDQSLQPDDVGCGPVLMLLPRLEKIVRYGSDNKFAAFVDARRVMGSPVRVMSGPRNRLTLV